MDTPFITLLDYLLLPFYLVIIFLIAYNFRETRYPHGHPWRPYFMSGLIVKICGSIGIGLIYQYYYGGGDTSNYFFHVQTINGALSESVVKWFNLLTHAVDSYDGQYFTEYTSKMYWYDAETEYTIAQIGSVLGLFTFTTFLPISVLFGTFTFTGLWALFRTFATKYPMYTKQIAICVLFIPSTVMWGSGLFKDTICMGALGWLTYGTFRILLAKDFRIANFVVVTLGFYLIARIKIYILLAYLPAMFLWILFTYSDRIPNQISRFVLKFTTVFLCLVGFIFFSTKFAADLGKYSLANLSKTVEITSTFIAGRSGDEGSTYSIGTIDPSPMGMLKIFPAAVNVTLFRPYIWETRKVLQLVNGVEALLFLWVTIKILITIGPRLAWKAIKDDPTIQFALIFTIIFSFAVGISSGNFGTLSRYRIPCLPFYGIALTLIYYRYNPLEDNILALKTR